MSFGFGFALPHWQTLSGGFSPASLFSAGEQGAWYDPSDSSTLFSDTAGTTPSPTPGAGALSVVGLMLDKSQNGVGTNGSYRYNLLTFTEQFDNAAWTSNRVNLSANSTTAPNGTLTADTITANGTAGSYYVAQSASVSGVNVTSVYVKANTNVYLQIAYGGDTTSFVNFDITAGAPALGTNGGTATGITPIDAGNGWYRCVATNTTSITDVVISMVPAASSTRIPSWTSNGSMYFWGAQLTTATAPTAYQRITAAWYSTMAGNHAISYNTTTARPELSARVNLLTHSEDQSNGVWVNYNATQQSNVGIAPDGTNTADRIIETSGAAPQARYQSIGAGLSIQYTVSAYAKAGERSVFNLSYSGTAGANWFAATFDLTGNGQVTKTGAGASGTYTSSSITPVGNGWYRCQVTGNTNQVSGHFVYGGPSDTTNPTYGSFGVPTYTGNTSNGVLVWGFDVRPTNIGTSVPSYQRIADQYTYDSSGFPRYLVFNGTASGMYTPASIPFATVTSDGQARRNLLNNPTQFDVTASWTRDSCTISANATTAPDGTITADKVVSAAATLQTGVSQSVSTSVGQFTQSWFVKQAEVRYVQLLWNGGASAEYANFDLQTGVVTQTTASVTPTISPAANGFYRITLTSTSASGTVIPYCWAIGSGTAGRSATFAGNGTDGWFVWGAQLETGSTATAFQNIGTDKVTVFAGVRKLDNTNALQLVELSTAVGSNVGAFSMPTNDISAGRWATYLSGSTGLVSASAAGTTAPITTVNAGLYDIALSADEARLRINGAQVATSGASNAGTGNFGTYPLYIGSRNNAGLYFNGYIYSLIVVGAASTAAQISSTESWINSKEGGVY